MIMVRAIFLFIAIAIIGDIRNITVEANSCQACENGAEYEATDDADCLMFKSTLESLSEEQCNRSDIQNAIKAMSSTCRCPMESCTLCPNDEIPSNPHHQPDLQWLSSGTLWNLHCITIRDQVKAFSADSDTCRDVRQYADECGCPEAGATVRATNRENCNANGSCDNPNLQCDRRTCDGDGGNFEQCLCTDVYARAHISRSKRSSRGRGGLRGGAPGGLPNSITRSSGTILSNIFPGHV